MAPTDIKRRLQLMIESATGIPPLEYIEALEAVPHHNVCVFAPICGYPHESGCIGCRIEKTCYKCGHFVDLFSKHL